jgi:signal transduction histidine kinase
MLPLTQQVLNDVLSFNRMQSGQLTQARKPFNFHKSISVVALAHRQQGSNVKLSIELDPHIDNVGLLVGDETRLRQITSNLLSNALKFTSEGTVTLITRLISAPPEEGWHDEKDPRGLQCRTVPASLAQTPCLLSDQVFNGTQPIMSCSAKSPPTSDSPSTNVEARNTGRLLNEKKRTTPTTPDSSSSDSTTGQRYATVRVEVQDSGAGLRGADLVDNRLFSPYVQTEIGRRQGGKGSGLGLALVMQLVKLSKGRLGVDSKLGVGSTFW